MNTKEIIRRILIEDRQSIREKFLEIYDNDINRFVEFMSIAYDECKILDSKISNSEEKAYISALVFTSINNHIVSLKLFILGYVVPSGNLQRQVFENIAMALLSSKIELGYIRRFIDGKYSTNNSIRDLKKERRNLSLDIKPLKILEDKYSFYHQYSHISKLTIASMISTPYEGKSNLILGASFDPGKQETYDKEINSRVGFAGILPNIIEAIKLNLNLI